MKFEDSASVRFPSEMYRRNLEVKLTYLEK